MGNEFKQIECNDDVVVERGENTYKIRKVKEAFIKAFNNHLAQQLNHQLTRQVIHLNSSEKIFQEGMNCQILKVGSPGWKRGKIKVNVK